MYDKKRKIMYKVNGTFRDAYMSLTVGQEKDARTELYTALGLQPQSRTAFYDYLNGVTNIKINQAESLRLVFLKYGIEWTYRPHPGAYAAAIAQRKAAV
jgi:hypothetical protein